MRNKIKFFKKNEFLLEINETYLADCEQNLLLCAYISNGIKKNSEPYLFIVENFSLEDFKVNFKGYIMDYVTINEIYENGEYIYSYFDYENEDDIRNDLRKVEFSLSINEIKVQGYYKEDFIAQLINNNILIASDETLAKLEIRPTYAYVENGMILKYYAKKRP